MTGSGSSSTLGSWAGRGGIPRQVSMRRRLAMTARLMLANSGLANQQRRPRIMTGHSTVSRRFMVVRLCQETITTKAGVLRARGMSRSIDATPTVLTRHSISTLSNSNRPVCRAVSAEVVTCPGRTGAMAGQISRWADIREAAPAHAGHGERTACVGSGVSPPGVCSVIGR